MTMKTKSSLGKAALVGSACMALLLSACSTTGSGAMAGAAPITYKADQGQYQQASVTMPSYTQAAPRRSVSAPLLPEARPEPVTPRAQPLPQAKAVPDMKIAPHSSDFDQKSIDRELYAHQRIGKKYSIMGKSYTPKHQPNYNKVGTASWYGDKFHGKLTANGETYDMNGITAAHKTLPLNSMVYVTNVETGKGIMVRINDRGPFVSGRIIDLSRQTAKRLGLFDSGLARVRVQYAGPADPNAHNVPRGPKQVPVTPRPKPKSDDLVAEVPTYQPPVAAPTQPRYQSLRDLGATPAQPVALPLTRPAPTLPQPFANRPAQPQSNGVNPLLGLRPLTPSPAAPQTNGVPTGDDPETLTIKGRVHMVNSQSDGSQEQARFIPAVNYTDLPAGQ